MLAYARAVLSARPKASSLKGKRPRLFLGTYLQFVPKSEQGLRGPQLNVAGDGGSIPLLGCSNTRSLRFKGANSLTVGAVERGIVQKIVPRFAVLTINRTSRGVQRETRAKTARL